MAGWKSEAAEPLSPPPIAIPSATVRESSTPDEQRTNQDGSGAPSDSTLSDNDPTEESHSLAKGSDDEHRNLQDTKYTYRSKSPSQLSASLASPKSDSSIHTARPNPSPERDLVYTPPRAQTKTAVTPRRGTRQNPGSGSFQTLHAWEAQGVPTDIPRHFPPAEMSRGRRGPGAHGRDAHKESDEEANLFSQVVQGLQEAATVNAKQQKLVQQILELEETVDKKGSKKTVADVTQLDDLYRQTIKLAEEESEILATSELINKMEILKALKSPEESQARNTHATSGKGRNVKRGIASGVPAASAAAVAAADGDGVAESPGPSPAETILSDKLKRVKTGPGQRSASVGSQIARSLGDGSRVEEGGDGLNRGTNAEKAGQLTVGAEVVYKHRKQHGQQEGEGIQCVIKNITGDGVKKRMTYDIQDIDEDQDGHKTSYKSTAAYLIPIPLSSNTLPTFSIGKQVLAKYPDTTTFYRAEVTGIQKEAYRLKFEGEEDDKEMEVDRRFVLDIGMGGK